MKFQIFSLAAVVLLILSPQVNAKKCTSYYSVIGGDTCGAIATKTKEPLNKLVSDNPGLICNSLAIGDVLCVGYSTTGTFPRLPIPDKKCSVKGTFAITFDDGPFMYTKGLLKYLKSKKLKATFFINGQNYGNIYNYSSSLKQIYKDGHQIAHHTWSHKDITVLSEIELRQEITMLEKAFIDILGVYPRFFRPPYGNTNLASLKILHELGYRVIKWDVTNDDAVGVENGPKTLSQQEMSFISTLNVSGIHPSNDGHISLSHDPKEITAKQFAPWVFNHVKKLGYKTQTVGECLGVPDHADWYRKK